MIIDDIELYNYIKKMTTTAEKHKEQALILTSKSIAIIEEVNKLKAEFELDAMRSDHE